MWAIDGAWERVVTALMAQAGAEEDLTWAVSVDSTLVRAHQHAAGACEKGARQANRGLSTGSSASACCWSNLRTAGIC
jgi:transposase